MEILVTGPDGVLGSNLVRELIHRNYNVHVLVEPGKDPITLKGLPITVIHGNILDADSINNAVEGKEIVFHCAAATSVYPPRNEMVNRVNIEGTQNIINSVIKHGVKRLIYVGTANSFSYGTSIEAPGVENTPYLSVKYGLDYMDSKYNAQQLILAHVKEHGLPALIVNPTFMIGPYDSRPSSGAMILAVHQGRVPGYSLGGKNYVAVKDVATAMANAITMGTLGECYIVGNVNLSYKDAFELIAKTIGAKTPTRKLTNFMVQSYGRLNSFFAGIFGYYPAVTAELAKISTENHFYSAAKAQRELQMPQTPLEVAIKECFEWFTENNYLDKK